MIIMKFGGTSTKDAASMLNVTNIVKSHIEKKPVVVISAIAQATNILEKISNSARVGNKNEAEFLLDDLIQRHANIINEGLKNKVSKQICLDKVNTIKEELKELISGVVILKELTPKILDRFYSYGEVLSSLLISFIMKENGIAAEWVDTREFMFTDDSFTQAKPIMGAVSEKLTSLHKILANENKTMVTQGFIGVTTTGDRTTMGRESSDYSAAIIGTVLNAEDIQIWTDVDGVLTGDPAIVDQPKKIKLLTFEEAYHLSMCGAKVLHPNTMLPAQGKNIPIHVFNSKRPEVSGTLICSSDDQYAKSGNSVLKSITSKKNIIFLRISPKYRYSPFIFWAHVDNILDKHNLIPLVSATSEYRFSAAFDGKSVIDSAVVELSEIAFVETESKLVLISLIGTNLDKSKTIIQETMTILNQYDIKYFSAGASDICITFLVEEKYADEIVKKMHWEYFEKTI